MRKIKELLILQINSLSIACDAQKHYKNRVFMYKQHIEYSPSTHTQGVEGMEKTSFAASTPTVINALSAAQAFQTHSAAIEPFPSSSDLY